jgi:hypothetical protein
MGIGLSLGLVVVLGVAGVSLFSNWLRSYVERELNSRVDAYDTRIGTLTVHPLALAVDLERLVVRVKNHPAPRPRSAALARRANLARVSAWHASRCRFDKPSDRSSHAVSSSSRIS